VVVRFGLRDELPDLLRRQPARVGDLRQPVAVLLQVPHVLVRRDPHDHQLAILVGTADRLDLDPVRQGLLERAVVSRASA
jgi:hypothetical protein